MRNDRDLYARDNLALTEERFFLRMKALMDLLERWEGRKAVVLFSGIVPPDGFLRDPHFEELSAMAVELTELRDDAFARRVELRDPQVALTAAPSCLVPRLRLRLRVPCLVARDETRSPRHHHENRRRRRGTAHDRPHPT